MPVHHTIRHVNSRTPSTSSTLSLVCIWMSQQANSVALSRLSKHCAFRRNRLELSTLRTVLTDSTVCVQPMRVKARPSTHLLSEIFFCKKVHHALSTFCRSFTPVFRTLRP